MTTNRAAHTRTPSGGLAGATAADPVPGPVPDPVPSTDADRRTRVRALDAYVRRLIGRVPGIPPHRVDTTRRPMSSLGIGSIAGLELQRRPEEDLRVRVDLQRLLPANSAAELVDCLAGQVDGRGRTRVDPV